MKNIFFYFMLMLLLIGCDNSMAKIDLETFPNPELITSIEVYGLAPDVKYRGLLEHKHADPLAKIEDSVIARSTYKYLLESVECCAELLDISDQTPNQIVRFTGTVRHKNLSLWIYKDFLEVSINPSPKFLMSNKFRLPEDRRIKILELLGL
jgi:hypothetical protein